jgi:putative PEP-CTERM system histidine kinase
MDSDLGTLTAWSYGFAAVGHALLAIYLFGQTRSGEGGVRTAMLLAATIFGLCWSAFSVGYGLTGSTGLYFIALEADVLRYGAWFAFLLMLLGSAQNLRWLLIVAVAIVLFGLIVHVLAAAGWGAGETLKKLLFFQPLLMAVFGLFLLEQVLSNVAVDSRWSIKPLVLGLSAAFLFDLYVNSETLLFARLDADAIGIRGLVHGLVLPLIALSAARSRDWVRKIRLSRKVVTHTTGLLAIGGYLLFMAAVGYYVRFFGGEWGRAFQLALVFAALLGLATLAFSASVRAKLRVLVGKHFFRYRYDYREEWLKVTRALSAKNSPQAMGEQVIRTLADLVESPAGGLWLWDAVRQDYRRFSRWNMAEAALMEPRESSLCQFLMRSGWIINLEEFRSLPSRYEALELPTWLSELDNAWLVVPLMAGSDLTGFVVLSSSRTHIDVNWEVNDLLRTAGSQAAGFLAQMLATEELLEARKFEAFNRMSAFVVHDLKNIVAQLSLMLKNAERHKDNPEFQQDMLMTVEHAVERMRRLMMQLREGTAPTGGTHGVELGRLFERIRAGKRKAGRDFALEMAEPVSVRGDEERLERVFGHLVQNSLDATRHDRRVWVTLTRDAGQARVEVGDEGQGMAPEFVRERLFKPFQTTKQTGMGIGAFESFQYIRELGGEVTVDSELNVGTRIVVQLPLFQTSSGSDLAST